MAIFLKVFATEEKKKKWKWNSVNGEHIGKELHVFHCQMKAKLFKA